jgi:predicted NBD/HSP70 family sugar kinase
VLVLLDGLRIAYETFTHLATKHGYAYAGMMACVNPPDLVVIGNVVERGHDLAMLLRQYAEIIEQKTDAGQIEKAIPRNVN